jgi:hypothetical protein
VKFAGTVPRAIFLTAGIAMPPSRQDIYHMSLDALRALIQQRLGLEPWPGDWYVAGTILEEGYFNFQRANTGQQLFGITLFGQRVTGSGIDENPLVAIFRAYLLMLMEEDELGR